MTEQKDENFLKQAKKDLGEFFNEKTLRRFIIQDNINISLPARTPKITKVQKIIREGTNHNEICRRAYEKLKENNVKVLLLQRPVPDLVIIQNGNIIAVEYEKSLQLELKVPNYENSLYDFVIILNEFTEIVLKKEGEKNIIRNDLKDNFKQILSVFQIPKIL